MDPLQVSVTPKSAEPMRSADQYLYSETMPLAHFLGAHAMNDHGPLSEIAAYFRGDKKEFTDIDLLHEVRHLETKLGAPKIGEKRLDQVYRYVKLQRQINDLETERDYLML